MLKIIYTREIDAPIDTVWDVIINTQHYPEWNSFVVACESSFEVGAPIKMKVKLFPFFAQSQVEKILQNKKGELLEYGIKQPRNLLQSSRQHKLTALDANKTHYESYFILQGTLAPMLGVLLGARLRAGFLAMTDGIVSRANFLHQQS